MATEQALEDTIRAYQENLKIKSEVKRLRDTIKQNHKLLIGYFFPYLLSVYEKWKPKLEERAMCIDFESDICFEVIVKYVDGNRVRAQEGESSNVYHSFNLNPEIDKHVVPQFILPESSYGEIKDYFKFRFLH